MKHDPPDVIGERTLDDASEQTLDALLAQATWPELDAATRRRLLQRIEADERSGRTPWLHASHSGRAAFAAAAVIAIGLSGWLFVPRHASRLRPQAHVERSAPRDAVPPVPASFVSPPSTGRSANVYERLIATSAKTVRTPSLKSLATPTVAVVRPVATATLAATRRAAALAELRRPAGTANVEAIRAFALTAGLADRALLQRCLQRSDLKRATYAVLAERGDAMAVDVVLSLVAEPATRGDALAALRSAERPAVDALIDRLRGPDVGKRFAAARALGSLQDGAAFARLSRMALADDHRREALAALLSSDTGRARSVLNDLIRAEPSIAAHVFAIQGELKNLF